MVRLSVLSAVAAGGQLALGQLSSSQVSSASAPLPTASALPNSGSNPLIPSSVSPSCQSYLESLNGDTALATCTESLLSALSSFLPQAGSTAFSATTAQVSDGLTSLCAQDSCDAGVVRSQLTQFYGNCSTEMQAGNDVILGQFDVLYVLVPMTEAICSQDSQKGWCLNDIATGSFPAGAASSSSSSAATSAATNATAPVASSISSSAVTEPVVAAVTTSASSATSSSVVVGSVFAPAASIVANATVVSNVAVNNATVVSNKASPYSIKSYIGSATSPQALFAYASSLTSTASRFLRRGVLAARASNSLTGVLPTADTWSASNLPFLFLSANMTSTLLCTDCTKSIMAPYIGWESTTPYPLGLSNSPLLGQQHVLWQGLGSTCGSGFLSSITQRAGQVTVSSSAAGSWAKPAAALLAGVAAVFTLLA